MYEAPRVCGHRRALWRRDTHPPVPDEDEQRFRAWVLDRAIPIEPD